MSKANGLSGTLPLTYYALPKRISIIASTVTNTAEGRGPNYSPNVARSHTHISGAMSIKACFYFSSNFSARREIRISERFMNVHEKRRSNFRSHALYAVMHVASKDTHITDIISAHF